MYLLLLAAMLFAAVHFIAGLRHAPRVAISFRRRLRLLASDIGDFVGDIPEELRGKTADQLREIVNYLNVCIRNLHADADGTLRSLTEDEDKAWKAGVALRDKALELIARHDTVAALADAPASQVRGDDRHQHRTADHRSDDPYNLDEIRFSPFDSPEVRRRTLRDQALRAIEADDGLDDEQKTIVERHIRRNREVAERVLVTGHPDYRSGWQAALEAQINGRPVILSAEQQRALLRAASLSNSSGGYAVPFTLDPTLILTNAGSNNPIRQLATVKTITTDQWNGVSTAGVTASYDAEAAEVSDDTPTLAQPTINTHTARAFVPFSIEIGMDWPDFEADVRMLFADARDRLEANKFALGAGDGSNEPKGIVTALTGTGQIVTSATTDTLAVADIYSVYEKPGFRWRSKGSWLANLSIYDKVRQFGTANNYHAFWTDLGGGLPPNLIGRPAYEAPDMDGTLTALAENYVAVYGDFSNYYIIDRVGMNVELVPHLFATANNLPSGQRGLFAWWRNGGDSVNNAAFGMLNVT